MGNNAMTHDFTNISGILWDLDNTLYRVDHALELAINHAVARAAISLGADISHEDAQQLAYESWLEHRHSAHVFMTRYNLSFHDMHMTTDKFLEGSVVEKCLMTRDLFHHTTQDHALITHSARPWALRTLEHLELKPWFPDHQVFGYEDYEFMSKAKSRKSFEIALASINKNPEDVMMVEDTLENLRVPREMGMKTVFLHHGKKPSTLPGFVDCDFSNVRELLEQIKGQPSTS